MALLEYRVDRLEEMMAELAHAQMRTEMSLLALAKETRAFQDEMRAFKDEMIAFKDEMIAFKDEVRVFKEETEKDRKRMNKAWGDLANKLGTVAEDIVAPNIPRLAHEEFHMRPTLDLSVRARRASRSGPSREGEFDILCADTGKVLVVEVKSSPSLNSLADLTRKLEELPVFYPEYSDHQRIGILASWSLSPAVCQALSEAGFYGLAMGDETMHFVARPQ